MKFMEKARHWLSCRLLVDFPGQPGLLTLIEDSFKEWQTAKNQYDFIEPELIDYMIYRLNAAEKHYTALLAQARAEGLTAWPENLIGEIREVTLTSNQQWAE